ncbi:MAG: ATP-binding cassette domain-containing protein [Candidatus Zipacnadales bacterium]
MIRTVNLSKRLGDFQLINVSVQIEEGEYFVMLGPTGAGKTIFVECIAGIYEPDSGSVLIDNENVTYLRPEERFIGYVPQDYALFPHLNVRENIGFGLQVRGASLSEIKQRTQHLAELLSITELLDRPIRTLSGGERQRVALARALAIRPRVLLLDEPLSAVDEQTRETLCIELKRLHRELQTTTIHVSHNFEETLSVADRIGVIRAGVLQQIGTPDEVFRRPANSFVAEFVRADNILVGLAKPERTSSTLKIETGVLLYTTQSVSGYATAVIRPEDVQILTSPPTGKAVNTYPVTIAEVLDRGVTVKLWLMGQPSLRAVVLRRQWLTEALHPGARVWAYVPPEAVHVFPTHQPPDMEEGAKL